MSKSERTYTISLANRKSRGSGHERMGEILAAASALFVEYGFENVSTRKIAEKVGISQAALFTYYKTKDEIFSRLVQDAFDELGRSLGEIEAQATDGRDWLRRCVAGYIAFGLGHPDEYRMAFMIMKPHHRNPELPMPLGGGHQVGMAVFGQLIAKVAQLMNDGVIRSDLGPPSLVAQILWGSIHGLVAALIARPKPHFPWDDPEVLARTQAEILLSGLEKR
jgi:AcrR family transcriptional regulator